MLTKKFSKTKPVAKVKFTLPAEAAQDAIDVRVLGDFNNWSWENGYKMQLKKSEYVAEVELQAGREYQFRYLIDNHIWENDWNADAYVPTVFGVYNSVLSLIPSTNGKNTAAGSKAQVAPATEPAQPVEAVKTTPKKPAADDLTRIEGIGPKLAQLLKDNGIATFADLAKANVDDIKAILEKAGARYKMHDPTTWPQQAALANKGEWEKLTQLQEELKGGKVK